jgi:hypothetical protein
MRDALASLRVLKVWIVPSVCLMVYLYLIVMVLVSYWLVVFKQGGGLPRLLVGYSSPSSSSMAKSCIISPCPRGHRGVASLSHLDDIRMV